MPRLAVFFVAASAVAQAPAPPQPVATMNQLMLDVIYPTSNAIFYVQRNPPKNDQEWNTLRGAALTLAESGNLLMMSSRARDQGDWMRDAKLLVDTGADAWKAAQAKDLDAIVALNDRLYAACVTCHEQYRPGYRKRQ
jgi:cytochrome c556